VLDPHEGVCTCVCVFLLGGGGYVCVCVCINIDLTVCVCVRSFLGANVSMHSKCVFGGDDINIDIGLCVSVRLSLCMFHVCLWVWAAYEGLSVCSHTCVVDGPMSYILIMYYVIEVNVVCMRKGRGCVPRFVTM